MGGLLRTTRLVGIVAALLMCACTTLGDPYLVEKDIPQPKDTTVVEDVSADAGDVCVPVKSWEGYIKAEIIDPHCGTCHGDDGKLAPVIAGGDGADLLDDNAGTTYPGCKGMTVAQCIALRMEDGTMPSNKTCTTDPPGEGCPTYEEIAIMKAWVEAGAPLTDDDLEPCDGPGPGPGPTGPDWQSEIKPLLNSYCGGCHAGTPPTFFTDPGLFDTQASASFPGCDGKTVAECVLILMLDGSMPLGQGCTPDAPGCPTQDELDLIQEWVDSGALHE